MNRKIIILLLLLGAWFPAVYADQAREYFEWGEYDSLKVMVSRYFAGDSLGPDSGNTCRYHAYLGVAHFSRKDIAAAQRCFSLALRCSDTISLDPQYVSPEMLAFFASVKKDLGEERDRHDKLAADREVERLRLEESERRRTADIVHTRVWVNTGAASFFTLAGITLGVLAVREHRIGETVHERFITAAAAGDLAAYEADRALLHSANQAITGYCVGAAAAGCLAGFFGWQAIRLHRTTITIKTTGGTNAVLATTGF